MKKLTRFLLVAAVLAFAFLVDVNGPCCWLELCCPPAPHGSR